VSVQAEINAVVKAPFIQTAEVLELA